MSVDYQHSQTGITLLMASAIHGKIDVVKAAISSGANPTLQVRLETRGSKLVAVCFRFRLNNLREVMWFC